MEDIYGMLVILSLGLGGALLVFMSECIFRKINSAKKQTGDRVRDAWVDERKITILDTEIIE